MPEPAPPTSPPSNLPAFLSTAKAQYLFAVHDGTAAEWVVVMGNEAGDLDSLASSLALALFLSLTRPDARGKVVPLLQTPHADLHLRPENLHALSLASLDPSALLCLDDVPSPLPSGKFALVDHNRLNPYFSASPSTAEVVAVVDHHDDEGLYTDTADPRVVQVPTGSCASLVALLYRERVPGAMGADLAVLLLSAIIIDTAGLKEGGKAERADREAAAWLSPLASRVPALRPGTLVHGSDLGAGEVDVAGLTRVLQERKFDVGGLGTYDLLRRDYKEYSLAPSFPLSASLSPSSSPGTAPVQVGLATVPRGLKSWLPADHFFWGECQRWMDARGLGVLGILMTFTGSGKKGKRKHKRQQLWIVRRGYEEVGRRLWEGLEGSGELEVVRKGVGKYLEGAKGEEGERGKAEMDMEGEEMEKEEREGRVRVYKQGNAKATRKAVAPLVRRIIEGG
ncbi:DHH phosphoesterase [Gloeophyllum trabeum ATCC 11539]|uniref:DHH phosphoesterase n=1 Tax=Gloeophyllum trabeum (strain ATCC 11539 / FP-39264 / Madison 617) TaxID=670483 RepID=S7PWQ9_GLOTA|nr:DHH phosphoesterase [Gloeophyllum trabeum ATCC 11539]EPQ51822.1 DHH phosphoesterase [Gloeophyllum trabeum ATCC 11539]